MILERWFSLPIWYDHVGLDMAPLAAKCLEMEAEGYPHRTVSNVGGWQSNDVKLNEVDVFKPLLAHVEAKVGEACRQIEQGFKVKYDNSWININRKGDANKAHCHPLTTLSACIYLQAPEGCGNIIFHGNDMVNHYPIFTDSPLFSTDVIYKPEAGKLLVFPACILHSVESNQSDEPRISIAFNFLPDREAQ